MRIDRSILLLCAIAASGPAFATNARPVPPEARHALAILTHLDLDSFPNSTGPRRRADAHMPADYGFTMAEGFPDGWAQIGEPDESWVMAALLLQNDKHSATICFTDSAGRGGTYRSTHVLQVQRDAHARWTAHDLPDRSDCKNDRAGLPVRAANAGPAPADILQHLDDFRSSLSSFDRNRLDHILHRSADGGIAQCDRTEGSRASCEVAAYMPALHRAGLMPRFLASPGPVPSAQGLLGTIGRTGTAAAAAAGSLSSAGWDVALDEAASGRPDWIDTVATLRTATDAGRSEAIDLALSDALLTNPSKVLRLIATRRAFPGTTWYCQDRSIEPGPGDTAKHDAAAMAAIALVTEPELASVRDQCLKDFKRARAEPRS